MKSIGKLLTYGILALLTILPAPSASAAKYDVVGCTEAQRESLPTTGWLLEPSGADFEIEADCTRMPVTLRSRYGVPSTAAGAGAGISYNVPSPLSIVGLTFRMLLVAPRSTDPSQQWWWDYATFITNLEGRTYQTGGCHGTTSPCSAYFSNFGYKLPEPATSMTWFLQCADRSPNPCPGAVSAKIFDSVFEVDDPEAPQITSRPDGALFAGGENLNGAQAASFHAKDAGSGVYRAVVEIDGVEAASITSNSSEHPNCVRPFRVAQPCPGDVVNGLTVDTATLADGGHTAVLRVYDATEQNSASYGPVRFSTKNRRLANFCGSESLRVAKSRAPVKPLRFGRRWTYKARLKGRGGYDALLLDGNNRLSVVGRITVPPDGAIKLIVPPGTNRSLRLAVRAPSSVGLYACSSPLRLRTRSRLSLGISPEEVSNGRLVRLRGKLFGKAGTKRSIVVQARARGSRRWATVRVIRTGRKGRFSMRYRFLATFRTVTYEFRAQVRAARGYPYATTSSPTRRVRVFG